jgi:hypothetical protein
MTYLRKPKPINGCKANGIRRKRSGWFHSKAYANFRSVKMFNNTAGGVGVCFCVWCRTTVYVGVCLSVEEIRMQENKKFTCLWHNNFLR